ncbi:MAG: radical SAM protein [Gudongella sp.]|jgi:radical SAM superfamily enzyme YgiQ (UPF0313 family)|nr:radical SAM protein [Gudongella sp.]
MKVLLVRPPRIKQAITISEFMFSEPLGLEMIYGLIEGQHKVEIFDMMADDMPLEEKLKSYEPDVVGFTSLCIDIKKLKTLAERVKTFDYNIVNFVGGTQTYLNPLAYDDESIDYIFEYTNRENVLKVLENISINKVEIIPGVLDRKLGYESSNVKSRNEFLLPNRESTRKYRNQYSYFGYKPAAIMEFGQGCVKQCNFCLRWRIEGAKEEILDLDLLRTDLASIKEDTIMFFDNDFLSSQGKIETFLEMVKELNLKKNYIGYASVKGIIEYEKYLDKLREVGLKALIAGYESFSNEEMKDYRKKSSVEDNHKAASILKRVGIDVWASFIGHPDWDKKDFKSLRKTIKELQPEICSISPLTPFPNLAIYEDYKDRLLYEPEDYERWSFGQVMISPSKISLRNYYYELLKTNLYINLFVNRNTEMLKKYGLKNSYLLLLGGIKTLSKYVGLMARS